MQKLRNGLVRLGPKLPAKRQTKPARMYCMWTLLPIWRTTTYQERSFKTPETQSDSLLASFNMIYYCMLVCELTPNLTRIQGHAPRPVELDKPRCPVWIETAPTIFFHADNASSQKRFASCPVELATPDKMWCTTKYMAIGTPGTVNLCEG